MSGLRASAILAWSAASLVLFGWQVYGDWGSEYAQISLQDLASHAGLVVTTFGAAALVFAAGLLHANTPKGAVNLDVLACMLSPLALACVVPGLLLSRGAETWTLALSIAVFAL